MVLLLFNHQLDSKLVQETMLQGYRPDAEDFFEELKEEADKIKEHDKRLANRTKTTNKTIVITQVCI